MSLPIPVGEELKEKVKENFNIREKRFYRSEAVFLDAYNKASCEILRRIYKQLKIHREDVILRRLIPQDLGLEKPLSNFNLEKGWNKDVIKTIPKRRFIAINGLTIPKNCSISQIIIWRGKNKIRHWHIEGFNGTYFFDDPFLIDMNQLLKIGMYSESKKKQKLIFHGSVVEELGRTINP